jgi:beta-1,4-mannosyltransferase
MRVCVVVLGDLGRSPRMQYHALALADDGDEVDLVGYAGRPPDAAVAGHPRIRIHLLPPPWRGRRLYLPVAAANMARQIAALTSLLLVDVPRPDFLLVQNPPAIPTLVVARLAARLRASRLVVDWHNFGADMLALRLGRGHPLVRAAAAVERRFGAGADAHLCVSAAMRDELAGRWGVPAARVLYDRPAKRVGPTPREERERLFARLGIEVAPGAAVLVTSSSWSADEDFAPLLEALAACDGRAGLPPLLVLMTGDGPLRAAWERRIEALGLRRTRVRMLWVAAEDYPRLLGAADVGLSFHRSASGVDLPMKIADMFGAGLPVCALSYGPVLAELVRPRENGLLFTTGAELAAALEALLSGFPDRTPLLDELRRGVARLAARGWAEGWAEEARPVFHA